MERIRHRRRGIANDRVIDAVEAYINGYADVAHTLSKLAYQKPNFQVCILHKTF